MFTFWMKHRNQLVPSSHQIQAVIVPREEALRYVRRLEQWYAQHTDEEIEQINKEGLADWIERENYETRLVKQQIELERKNRKKHPGYVYLLKSPYDDYKIGMTKAPNQRFKAFNTKLPFQCEFICMIETDDCVSLETELHTRFNHRHIRGEWFSLQADEIEYIKGLATS